MGGLLGLATGLILGLTGAGGSILAVPLLMGGLGWSVRQAAPIALLAVCAAATLGTIMAWRQSYVRYRAALLMAGVGVLTAPLGLLLAAAVPPAGLALAFAGVMTVVALRMIRQSILAPADAAVLRATVQGEGPVSKGPVCALNDNGRIHWTLPCFWLMAAIGATTGFLSGLFGVGGGFLIVPALRFATPLSMHSAVATSLMTIALTSAGTIAVSIQQGHDFPLVLALTFVAGALVGMLGGRWIGPKIAGARLQQGFAVLMLLVAAGMALHALDKI